MTMQTKWCGAGKHEVNITDFHKKGHGLQPNCKVCQNALNRARYKANSKAHITQVRQNTKLRNQVFYQWKATQCCVACGEAHRSCIDFHHIDPSSKDFTLGDATTNVGWNKLISELRKCVIVCKNCHCKVHDDVIVLPPNSTVTEAQIEDLQKRIMDRKL